MTIRYFERGFNFGQDGPGNRLVYHLTGCNMRCAWCANPEGMAMDAACKEVSVRDVAQAIISARPMFFGGGGLTLTGGEATMQPDAVLALLKAVRAEGVNTCMETNAYSPRFPEFLPLVDHLIADLKHPDDEAHRRFTGLGNAPVLKNLALAARSGRDVLFRLPLIHRVNDDARAMDGFVDFFAGINGPNVRIEVLPYHEYGKDKWIKAFGSYAMTDAFVDAETVAAFAKKLAEAGLQVVRT